MRRNHFEMDLDGEQKAITKAVQAIRALPELKRVDCRQRRVELHLHDDATTATTLASVLTTINDNKVSLVSLRSVGQQTEEAFLDLVEKDESRGFARIYRQEAA
jgi:ABC-2 type transport system ATP-binding protein